ncbi:MAG: hypothetical protein JXB50_01895, partial [Spirochaetes bacterium]|nr:hypothetical protein [Spirochaetota bacterium]
MKIDNKGISITFLDVLTCAIGGLMIILIIFMTLEHSGKKVTLVSEDENKGKLVIPLEEAVLGKDEISAYLFEVHLKHFSIQPDAHLVLPDTLNTKGVELITLNKQKSTYLVLVDQPKKVNGRIDLVLQRVFNAPVTVVVKKIIGPEHSVEKSYTIPAGNTIVKPFFFNEASGLHLSE